MARYIDTAETAKLIRAALKRAFPAVKFTVRSSRYSGGSSIRVGWTDGPLTAQVEAIAKSYQGGAFDGSIDLAYSVESYLLADGSAALAKTPGTAGSGGSHEAFRQFKPAADAERVRFCADHVFCNREISPEMKARALDRVRARFALSEDCSDVTVIAGAYGSHLSRDPYLAAWNCSLSDLVYRDTVRRVAVKGAA